MVTRRHFPVPPHRHWHGVCRPSGPVGSGTPDPKGHARVTPTRATAGTYGDRDRRPIPVGNSSPAL